MNISTKFTLLLLICAVFHHKASAQDREPLPCIAEEDFNPVYYVGRWYQTHASRFVYNTIEPNATCVTATYAAINVDPVQITVLNSQNGATPGEEYDDIEGFATYLGDCRLSVEFPSLPPGPDTNVTLNETGNYWIMQLGPVNEDNQYDYSLVSEPTRFNLFVLARDIETFEQEYEEEVLEFLYANGFNTTLKEPVKTLHTDECYYPPQPSPLNEIIKRSAVLNEDEMDFH